MHYCIIIVFIAAHYESRASTRQQRDFTCEYFFSIFSLKKKILTHISIKSLIIHSTRSWECKFVNEKSLHLLLMIFFILFTNWALLNWQNKANIFQTPRFARSLKLFHIAKIFASLFFSTSVIIITYFFCAPMIWKWVTIVKYWNGAFWPFQYAQHKQWTWNQSEGRGTGFISCVLILDFWHTTEINCTGFFYFYIFFSILLFCSHLYALSVLLWIYYQFCLHQNVAAGGFGWTPPSRSSLSLNSQFSLFLTFIEDSHTHSAHQ